MQGLRLTTIAVIVLECINHVYSTCDWDYSSGVGGPANWSATYTVCSGSNQSPIDLPPNSSMTYSASLNNITLANFDNTSYFQSVLLENNGRKAVITVDQTGSTPLEITGGGLSGTYIVEQVHLRWGNATGRGSEHTYNGMMYDGELQILAWDSTKDNFTYASTQSNGLAGFAFWIEESGGTNAGFSSIQSELSNVATEGSNSSVTGLVLMDLLPADLSKYFRYSGSLTYPPCSENVIWTIFESTIQLSTAQMNALRGGLNDCYGNSLENNFRPVLSRGSRTVMRNFRIDGDGDLESSAVDLSGCTLLISLSVFLNASLKLL